MDILVEQQSEALIFAIQGRLDGSTAPELQEQLMSHLAAAPVIVLDCAALDYISSAGLRVLLLATKERKKAKRPFGLCNLQDEVREVFKMSGFISIIDTFDSRAQALETLAPPA
jgi:anti-anti-sigma factor